MLNIFFSNSELYEKTLILENYQIGNESYYLPEHFAEATFDYFCKLERKTTTFQIDWELRTITSGGIKNEIPEDNLDDDGKLDYTFMCIGYCRSCNQYEVNFMVNVTSDKPVSHIIDNSDNYNFDETRVSKNSPDTNIYAMKVGINPPMTVWIDPKISKHFTPNAEIWYRKGLELIGKSYGIGAYGYLRRIIETELIKIIDEIKELPESDKPAITKLLEEYKAKPFTSTIYENVFQYLPNSLKSLGDNPFKLLYNQASEGLHGMTDEECLRRAKDIITVLDFTLMKINEEQSQLKSVKDAIKALRKP